MYLVFILIFGISSHLFSSQNSVLVTVNGQNISSDQFIGRYKTYLSKVGVKDNIVVRKQILENMINEKLILANSQKQNWYFSKEFRSRINSLAESNLIIEFYKNSFDSISISDKEMRIAFLNMNTKIRARHLYAATYEKGIVLRNRIINGESFEKLAKEIFTDSKLKNNGGDLGYFSIGEMESPIEIEAFSMPMGELSFPIKTDDGFSIIRVEEKIVKPFITETDFANQKNKVSKYLIALKKELLSKELSYQISVELKITFNETEVRKLLLFWKNYISKQSTEIEATIPFYLKNKNNIITNYKNGNITTGSIIDLSDKLNLRQKMRVRNVEDLKNLISGLLVRNEIIINAKNLELEKTDIFKSSIAEDSVLVILKKWTEDVILKNITIDNKIYKSKNKKEEKEFNTQVRNKYEQNKSKYITPDEINIAEIFVTNQNFANQLLDSLALGKSFSKLATEYSERTRSAKQNGELGFGDRFSYGIYADTLFNISNNKIIGPFQLGSGYSIFKLIDKSYSKSKKFEEVREEISAELFKEWSDKVFFESLTQLRKNSKIEINYSLVEELIMQ